MKRSYKMRGALRGIGVALLVWGALNTGVDIYRYGIGNGFYWWFCNLALVAMGYGLVMEDRGLITAFLAIASYTQVFWLLDNIWMLFGHEGAFGLVDYMYQPGFPMDEFLLAHYHYFTIPVAIVAVLYLPKSRMSGVRKAAFLNPFIFAVSYIAFSSAQNVNCIHRSCMPGYENISGPFYSLIFWLVLYGLNLVFAWALEKHAIPYFTKVRDSRKFITTSMAAVCAVALVSVAVDGVYKASLPTISCAQNPSASDSAAVSCRNITFNRKDLLMVGYRANNPTSVRVLCRVEMQLEGVTTLLHEELPLEPHSHLEYKTAISTPSRSVQVNLVSKCEAPHQTAMNE